jgi:hypothetical protein
MKGRAAALAVGLLSLSAGLAQAHTVIDGIGGFPGGLLHPLLVPAHALALIGLGCLTSTLDGRARLLVIAVFIVAAAISIMLVTMAFSAVDAELIVLSLAGFAGLLLTSGLPIPSAVIAVLAMCIAMAVTFDSVPAVISAKDRSCPSPGPSSPQHHFSQPSPFCLPPDRRSGDASASAFSGHGSRPAPSWCWPCDWPPEAAGLLANRRSFCWIAGQCMSALSSVTFRRCAVRRL